MDMNFSLKRSSPQATWNRTKEFDDLSCFVSDEVKKTLEAYRSQPNLVTEHANQEQDTVRGGYAERQLYELVQNGADALSNLSNGGRILIRLTNDYLYCADNGNPISKDGIRALMFSHMSPKRNTKEIGRFGVGFKSVLGVCDSPEFFSKSGSFRFDRHYARKTIKKVVPDAERYPVLRIPEPIDCENYFADDKVLADFTHWASNIVRLPLLPRAMDSLSEQIRKFPVEFLLFARHVNELRLEDSLSAYERKFEMQEIDGIIVLADTKSTTQWKIAECTHSLSPDALADRRSLDDDDQVLIRWAVPIDRMNEPGKFWAYFPTLSSSLVAGILNAPWKTNEDRQNLLAGPYNDELIRASANLIAENLHKMSDRNDPAHHLDVLPRRHEAGDSPHVRLLREILDSKACEVKIVPDQHGKLCPVGNVRYPPNAITQDRHTNWECLEKWSSFNYRPSNWLHNKAITRNRFSIIDRLFYSKHPELTWDQKAPRASISEWLQSLINSSNSENQIEASRVAIQTAALIPDEIRKNNFLGKIVLTAKNEWRAPDVNQIYLPQNGTGDQIELLESHSFVHPLLVSDIETNHALKILGFKSPSIKSQLEAIVYQLLKGGKQSEDILKKFWKVSREFSSEEVIFVIQTQIKGNPALNRLNDSQLNLQLSNCFRVLTRSGTWKHRHSVLIPSDVVPGDGSRDNSNTIDMSFHERNSNLLNELGFTRNAVENFDVSIEPWFDKFLNKQRREFKKRKLSRKPMDDKLNFESTQCSGPLEILKQLSVEAQADYTESLLSLDITYEEWTMRHDTQSGYPALRCDSPAIGMIRNYGKIRTTDGIVQFSDALGPHPKNTVALGTLMKHRQAGRIKKAFELMQPIPEFVGEEDAVPLFDIWPGLESILPAEYEYYQLVRCEAIVVLEEPQESVNFESSVYVVAVEDELRQLQSVANVLELELSDSQLKNVLEYTTKRDIEKKRAEIKRCSTDAERLLKCVGEEILRSELPTSLCNVLESGGIALSGIQLSYAAIATYHTDSLNEFSHYLDHLGPPRRWSGSGRALEFVYSLGFDPEWAGERKKKRDPYLEVIGSHSLPPLHDYQQRIVDNIKSLLKGRKKLRRGMMSMPTGSGKTRVAVQAIAEAIRDDVYTDGVLWVADRDEICEQAVEAWHQVWTSIGRGGQRLRISRMWASQPNPLPKEKFHVVVATIQTLHSKLTNPKLSKSYEFIKKFKLVVFDEAHRSISSTSTNVMEEIGLTRYQKEDEPFLLGLTATPYRGHDEAETFRLTRRYSSNRLDRNAFASEDPVAIVQELQLMGVLAEADHELIAGEVISEDKYSEGDWKEIQEELKAASKLPWLPQSIANRIAESSDRTKRIIEAYEKHVEQDWPTLIFATSVEHSKTLAALLNMKGITSRSVSGYTSPATRRKIVEEFRNGNIQVLVNYGVFAEGFDAPKTRVIIVARPVYSPNLYFQMIGRGLRGVKNGGNDRCLIINVEDNIESFQQDLAFSELDWLWA